MNSKLKNKFKEIIEEIKKEDLSDEDVQFMSDELQKIYFYGQFLGKEVSVEDVKQVAEEQGITPIPKKASKSAIYSELYLKYASNKLKIGNLKEMADKATRDIAYMNDQIMQLREVMEGTGAFDKLTKILESND
jgi:hypothetical protein